MPKITSKNNRYTIGGREKHSFNKIKLRNAPLGCARIIDQWMCAGRRWILCEETVSSLSTALVHCCWWTNLVQPLQKIYNIEWVLIFIWMRTQWTLKQKYLRITAFPPATLSTPIWMLFTLKSILASSTRKYVRPSCWSTGTALKYTLARTPSIGEQRFECKTNKHFKLFTEMKMWLWTVFPSDYRSILVKTIKFHWFNYHIRPNSLRHRML